MAKTVSTILALKDQCTPAITKIAGMFKKTGETAEETNARVKKLNAQLRTQAKIHNPLFIRFIKHIFHKLYFTLISRVFTDFVSIRYILIQIIIQIVFFIITEISYNIYVILIKGDFYE